MITISEHFEVPYPPLTVWAILSDPNAVVQCVEGAELGESLGDGSFKARTTVKFGALRIHFNGQVSLDLDEDAMEGHLTAQGKDAQGGARFRATTTFNVTGQAQNGGSVVTVQGEVDISGKLVSVIEAGASRVVRRLTDNFSENLTAQCAMKTELSEAGEATVPSAPHASPSTSLSSIFHRLRRSSPHNPSE
jgi:carbon monoxide dehydrogenase subunit G